jgi:hypothetical protein
MDGLTMIVTIRANRRTAAFCLALLAFLLTSGCFLAPEEGGSGHPGLRIIAYLPGSSALETANDEPDWRGLLERGLLSARARLLYSSPSCTDPCCADCTDGTAIAGQSMLTFQQGGEIPIISGSLEIAVRSANRTYCLVVELLQRGEDVQGTYGRGKMSLESAIEIDIDSMTLDRQGQIDTSLQGTVCVSHPSVDHGRPACTSDLRGSYLPASNAFTLRYTSPPTVEGAEGDSILVTLRGGLVPVVVARGCARIVGVELQVGGVKEVTLDPISAQPTARGEKLAGNVAIQLWNHGAVDLEERGAFFVLRD